MRLSWRWLSELVDLSGVTPEEGQERLTFRTAEVESVTAVGQGLGGVVAGRVLRPIGRITGVAREIQATDLSRRIHLRGPNDELRQLADTFDAMLARLDAAFESQRRFIHEASHELRNPLAVIRTNLDVVMSDHDPQDVETKRLPFAEAEPGAIGLETMLSAGLRLVHAGDLPLMTLLKAMSTRPAELLGIPAGTLKQGARADVIVVDLDVPWVLDPADLKSKCKNTPFDEARLQGRVVRTIVGGRTVYEYV